jgi:hypothetical protein
MVISCLFYDTALPHISASILGNRSGRHGTVTMTTRSSKQVNRTHMRMLRNSSASQRRIDLDTRTDARPTQPSQPQCQTIRRPQQRSRRAIYLKREDCPVGEPPAPRSCLSIRGFQNGTSRPGGWHIPQRAIWRSLAWERRIGPRNSETAVRLECCQGDARRNNSMDAVLYRDAGICSVMLSVQLDLDKISPSVTKAVPDRQGGSRTTLPQSVRTSELAYSGSPARAK